MKRPEKLIIGQRLRVLRRSLGLTQAQLAAELGVSASYITLIEADQRPASARLLMRLAKTFKSPCQIPLFSPAPSGLLLPSGGSGTSGAKRQNAFSTSKR